MADIGDIAARLNRIRTENLAGRATTGLGAVNIPFAQRYGLGLGADVSLYAALNSHADQLSGSSASLSRFNSGQAAMSAAVSAKRDASQALIEARRASAEARRAFTMAQYAGDPGSLPAADRIRRGGGSRFGGKGGFSLGPLKLGRSGLRLATGGLRGPLGAAFTVGIANHIVGSSMNQVGQMRDTYNDLRAKGATTGEIARAAGGGAARRVVSLLGVESLASGLLRAAGNNEDTTQRLIQRAFDETFLTREELQRRADARRRAIEDAHKEVAKVQAAERKLLEDYEPSTFRPRTQADRRIYRRELLAANEQTQRIKREVRIDLATREATGE